MSHWVVSFVKAIDYLFCELIRFFVNTDIGLIDGMSYTENVWVGGRNIGSENAWY